MEHPTLTSIGTSILANTGRDITTLLVHELSHDWWGDRVTMRTWDDIWVNEGFATYGEVLYLEKTFGFAPGATLSASVAGITLDPAKDLLRIVESTGPV
jgi:aminopeptidase N